MAEKKKLRIQDLAKIREKTKALTTIRESEGRAKVTVHMGTCGIAAGARKIVEAALREVEEGDLRDVMVTTSGCAGLCSREPMATVEAVGEAPVKYVDLTEAKVKVIFKEHILGGKIVEQHALAIGSERAY